MNVKQIVLTCLIWTWTSAEIPPVFVKRHYNGDLFEYSQGRDCPLNMCSVPERHAVPVPWKKCQCQCLPLTPTFRQDTGTCVDSLDECQLVPFQSPVDSENIPLVSMPDSGKYVHPSAEIVLGSAANHFNDVVCHVLLERYLSPKGWLPLTNLSHPGPTFQLVHHSKKIFLQFVGDEHERSTLDGHLILVEFTCKTKNKANIVPHPCAAFRVAGKLSMASTKDVLVAVDPSVGRWRDWIIIGLGAGLLGVTYVLAILVYVVVRKRHEKKMSGANAQLQSIRTEPRFRVDRKAMKPPTSTWSESTSSDRASFDSKFHSRISLSGAMQNPSCEENQSGPSRLLSQLRSAWNAATTKLRGRRLTFSPSLLDIPAESESFCRSTQSSESSIRCQSPRSIGSDDNSCRSSTGDGSRPRDFRLNDVISDPVPLLNGLRRSSRHQSHFADGSARIAIAQKLPESKKRKPRHFPGPETAHLEKNSDARIASMDSVSSETLRDQSGSVAFDRCKGHCRSLADSVQRKAASCENVTVLTVVGASGPEIDDWTQKKCWRPNTQQIIAPANGKGYYSLQRGQENRMTNERRFGTFGENFGIGRSESTCSIDCKRKSVSFDLRDTVILGEEQPVAGSGKAPSVATVKKDLLARQNMPHFDGEEHPLAKDGRMCGSDVQFRKMTSFATLRWQSKSNEFLHLNDCVPQTPVVRIVRSESSAGDYRSVAVQRLMENGEVLQPLASILKRSESSGRQGRPTAVSRSQSVVVHPSPSSRQKCAHSGALERVPVKSLVDSFNQKTFSMNTAVAARGLENKRIWQVVNEDSGYHSSDSDKSLKQCSNGQRPLVSVDVQSKT